VVCFYDEARPKFPQSLAVELTDVPLFSLSFRVTEM
jgi:hypothetical protein